MKRLSKQIAGGCSLLFVAALGYEVASHEAAPRARTTLEKIEFSRNAYAENLDRGFADLVKRVVPGVVNISTFSRPKPQQGFGPNGMGQNELFQRFFEEFFGGRMPGPRGQLRPGPRGNDDDESPRSAPKGPQPKSIPFALGTGFIIDATEGLIMTNNHVIEGADEVKIQFTEEVQDLIPAEVIGRDPDLDVALLKVKTKTKLVAIPLGDSDAIDVGEYLLAVGNPLGYGHTVSHGILSAKGRRNPEFKMGRYLQTDASINPGNSGGPLINVKGEVVGINNAIDARAQGIGFAIPINLVKTILTQLKTKGSVSRGFLGVGAEELTPEIAEQLNIDPNLRGVIVSDVGRGMPADLAGVKPYDVITAVNGEKIASSQDLTLKIIEVPIGSTVKLNIVRAGKAKVLEAKVIARPVAGMNPRKAGREVNRPGENFAEFGFKAENLNAQNGQAFGIPPDQKGVVITDVDANGGAARSGLNRGDLLMDITIKEVHQDIFSLFDLEKALKGSKEKTVMLRVKRYDSVGNEFVSVVVLTQ